MRQNKILIFICLVLFLITPALSSVMGSLPETSHDRPDLKPADVTKADPPPAPELRVIRGTVKGGEAISMILDPYLPLKVVYKLNRDSKKVFSLGKIRPGHAYSISLKEGRMVRFAYHINTSEQLVIQKEEKNFSIQREPLPSSVVPETISGQIHSTLFQAIRDAGANHSLAGRLSRIFSWDIDFERDIRPGDSFRLIVEKRMRENKFLGYGHILAASFTIGDRTYKAFFNEDPDGRQGYYDEHGHSLEKAFLKAPMDHYRITSGFTMKRMHPILKEYRPHPAVDYAAPVGTPIKTVGDGIVADYGFSRTMGNYIILRHPNGYMTRYFHLNRFSKTLTRRKNVRKGEVIGFVGKTGYATGPHLCFRMTHNGQPVNPLKLKRAQAAPIPTKALPEYMARTERFEKQLESTTLAMLTAKNQ